jgi:hypothetical protein
MVISVTKGGGKQKLPRKLKIDWHDHSLESSWGALSDGNISFSMAMQPVLSVGKCIFLIFLKNPQSYCQNDYIIAKMSTLLPKWIHYCHNEYFYSLWQWRISVMQFSAVNWSYIADSEWVKWQHMLEESIMVYKTEWAIRKFNAPSDNSPRNLRFFWSS